MSSNDGTGLRELAAKWRADADKCDAADDYERGMADASRIDAAQLESALSAVAPPPVSEGCAPGWGIAGNYGDGKWRCFREGASQTYLGYPKTTANEAIAETHRLAMLAATPAAPAQQEVVGDWFGPDSAGAWYVRHRDLWFYARPQPMLTPEQFAALASNAAESAADAQDAESKLTALLGGIEAKEKQLRGYHADVLMSPHVFADDLKALREKANGSQAASDKALRGQ